jgi:sialate O-acetylesterase
MVRFVKSFLIAVVVSVLCPVFTVFADVKLPAIVGDSMVLQQQTEVNIWGWADPNEKITVAPSWAEEKYTCVTCQDGKWKVKIKTPQAGGPYTLKIAGKNTLLLDNILIGEVWVCSGQSNMQFHLGACKGAEEAIPAANYPEIRLFTVDRIFHRAPREDCKGRWVLCSPETANGFSGVAYFYGLELYKALGVPIGLINSSWGGTLAEAWTSAETLKTLPDFVAEVEDIQSIPPDDAERIYQEKMKEWKIKFYALDKGMQEEWFKPGFDFSSWETMETPQKWDLTAQLTNFDGLVWFSRDFQVDAGMVSTDKGFTLELGPIDDMDITWVNGQRVGGAEEMGFANVPRKYNVPAGCIKAGKNTITVRVHDWLYAGGFSGKPEQLKLTPVDKGVGSLIPLAGLWHYKITVSQKEIPAPPPAFHNNSPTALYNGMIAPINSFGIAGAIWYQGESNAGRAYQYRELFPAMIKDWREKWGRGDFPFYYVQIAPYNYGPGAAAAELREAQLMSLSVPNVGMAVTMDIGDPKDIHPTNKKDVGHRLALCALAKTYGKDVKYLLPVYKSMEVQGDKIVLSFDNTYGGLYALNGPLANFTIAADDKKFVPAEALIDGNRIIVSSSEIKNPVAVRFAWNSYDESNLFNIANLSSSSFRTDNWPGDTIDNK